MKKIIGIFAILLLGITVFGQAFLRSPSFIETTEKGGYTIEDDIRNPDWVDFERKYKRYVHFIQNDILFLLSYEPKEDYTSLGSRGIYLYSKDINDINSPWIKASEIIMTNSFSSFCYDEVDFKLAKDSRGSVGNVKINDDNTIEITIGWLLMNRITNNCEGSVLKYRFVPNGFGRNKYLFERIYK